MLDALPRLYMAVHPLCTILPHCQDAGSPQAEGCRAPGIARMGWPPPCSAPPSTPHTPLHQTSPLLKWRMYQMTTLSGASGPPHIMALQQTPQKALPKSCNHRHQPSQVSRAKAASCRSACAVSGNTSQGMHHVTKLPQNLPTTPSVWSMQPGCPGSPAAAPNSLALMTRTLHMQGNLTLSSHSHARRAAPAPLTKTHLTAPVTLSPHLTTTILRICPSCHARRHTFTRPRSVCQPYTSSHCHAMHCICL